MSKIKTNALGLFFKGLIIGAGSIAPGVSGGLCAVLFGLYDKLIDAIANFYKDFKTKLAFLIPIGLGGLCGILLFSRLIGYVFANYESTALCLFLGLMAGTIPSLLKKATSRGFRARYAVIFTIAFLVSAVVWQISSLGLYLAEPSFLSLFLSGAIIGAGSIVPGISASFILTALGGYTVILQSISDLNVINLLPVALGVALSVAALSKLVDLCYKRAFGDISFAVLGLLIGSMLPVIPASASPGGILIGVAGLFLALFFTGLASPD